MVGDDRVLLSSGGSVGGHHERRRDFHRARLQRAGVRPWRARAVPHVLLHCHDGHVSAGCEIPSEMGFSRVSDNVLSGVGGHRGCDGTHERALAVVCGRRRPRRRRRARIRCGLDGSHRELVRGQARHRAWHCHVRVGYRRVLLPDIRQLPDRDRGLAHGLSQHRVGHVRHRPPVHVIRVPPPPLRHGPAALRCGTGRGDGRDPGISEGHARQEGYRHAGLRLRVPIMRASRLCSAGTTTTCRGSPSPLGTRLRSAPAYCRWPSSATAWPRWSWGGLPTR